MIRPVSLAAAGLCLLLAACSSTPPQRHYTLGPVAEPAAAVSSATAGPSLVIGPVGVPEAIDRLQILRTVEGARAEVSEANRWAGPLKDEIARRLAGEIARQRGFGRVVAWPQTSVVQPDLTLPVDVLRFEARGFESVTLEAVWTLRQNGKDLASRRFAATEAIAGGNYEGLAAAHGRLVDALARDVATALKTR